MYLPAHFAAPDTHALQQLMRARPLATLVGHADGGLFANHLPLYFSGDAGAGVLRGHVARANPLWRALDGRDVLAIFHGPDAYVSPTWYPAKAVTGKAVPTWNYAVAHVHGVLRAVDDAAWLRSLLDTVVAQHEAGMPSPWQIADAPADYIAAMIAAVVGIEIRVARLEGKWKASQNQSAENLTGVIQALHGSGDAGDAAMAALMTGLTDGTRSAGAG